MSYDNLSFNNSFYITTIAFLNYNMEGERIIYNASEAVNKNKKKKLK